MGRRSSSVYFAAQFRLSGLGPEGRAARSCSSPAAGYLHRTQATEREPCIRRSSRDASVACGLSGAASHGWFFLGPQPGKAGVERGDGCGGGVARNRGHRDGYGWRRGQQGAAEALVAAESFTAAGADQAELQRIFVEQNVGVISHELSLSFRTPHSLFREGEAREKSFARRQLRRKWQAAPRGAPD
jgi:hypothetical protein